MSGGSTRLESRGSKDFTNQSYGNTHTHIEQMQIVRKNIKQPLKHQVDFSSSLCKKSKQSSPKKMSFFRVDPGDWSSKWCHFQTQRLIVEHRLAVPKNLLALRGQVPNKKKMLVGRRWSFHKYFLCVYVFFFFCFFVARGQRPSFFWVFGVSFRERLAQPSPTQWLSDRGENGRPRGGGLSVVTWRDGWHYMKSLLIARDPLQWLITSIHRHNHIFMEFQQGFVILWLIVCHIVPIRILTMAY